MTETEKMIRETNGLLKMMGDEELAIPNCASELELLRTVKEEYKQRLLAKIPKYKSLSSEALIPDMLLQALRNRESKLTSGAAT